jgi:hypothetical protein
MKESKIPDGVLLQSVHKIISNTKKTTPKTRAATPRLKKTEQLQNIFTTLPSLSEKRKITKRMLYMYYIIYISYVWLFSLKLIY